MLNYIYLVASILSRISKIICEMYSRWTVQVYSSVACVYSVGGVHVYIRNQLCFVQYPSQSVHLSCAPGPVISVKERSKHQTPVSPWSQ